MFALLLALQVTTTTCTPAYGGAVNCSTYTPPAVSSRLPAVPDYYGRIMRSAPPVQQPDYSGIIRARVGKMLAKGDCDGALQYALKNGRLDLATSVREYCAR